MALSEAGGWGRSAAVRVRRGKGEGGEMHVFDRSWKKEEEEEEARWEVL